MEAIHVELHAVLVAGLHLRLLVVGLHLGLSFVGLHLGLRYDEKWKLKWIMCQ